MNHQKFLLDEYKQQNGSTPPLRFTLGKNELIVPVSYQGDLDAFVDDLFSFQDNEYKKYERYNKRHPDNSIDIREIMVDGIHIIVPFKYTTHHTSDSKILHTVYQKALNRYKTAIEKTKRAKEEYPDKNITTSLSKKHLSDCSKLHTMYILGKIAKGIGKTTKWTAKQSINAIAGTIGSPIALAYKILDNKHRISVSPSKKRWIDDKALPYIKKGFYKAMIVASLYGSAKVYSAYEQYQENKAKTELRIAKENAEKEAFFQRYNTTDETFYQNYKTAKEHESLIVALIACPEGFREDAYLCQADKITGGYGARRTVVEGQFDEQGFPKTRPIKMGMTFTKEKAYEDVVAHLEKYVYPQLGHINKVLQPTENAAVCMFVYNTDENAFKESMLCSAINNHYGNDVKIREAFSIIRSVNGKRSYGLINRHGFEGGCVWCSNDPAELLSLKPTIVGSPDITYYEYGKNKRNPKENSDQTFVVRPIKDIKEDMKKFVAYKIDSSMISLLPDDKKQQVIQQYNLSPNNNESKSTSIVLAKSDKAKSTERY